MLEPAALWRRVSDEWQRLHLELLRAPAAENEPPASEPGSSQPKLSLQPLVVLAAAAVCLTLIQVFGTKGSLAEVAPSIRAHPSYALWNLMYWVGWCIAGYALLPALVVALLPGERLASYGVSLRGYFRHLPVYLLLFAAVAPLIIIASFGESFQHTYPFYDDAGRSWRHFLLWEALYGSQFAALEFFFRGFLLFGLCRYLGVYSIFVMIVPYCMIHFTKPFPEILGSIVAGLILGTLALRTRSIWGGITIHALVATSMDLLALWHTHRFPRSF